MSPAAAADGGLGVLASCARPSPADEQSAATPANSRLRMLTPVIVVATPKAKALFFPHHLKGACDQQQPSLEPRSHARAARSAIARNPAPWRAVHRGIPRDVGRPNPRPVVRLGC